MSQTSIISFTYSAVLSIIVFFLSYIYYRLPSPLNPVLWTNPSPLLTFSNQTKQNKILQNAEVIDGEFSGPESIAFSDSSDIAYISFSDGAVGSFWSNGTFIRVVFFVGGFLKQSTTSGNEKLNGLSDSTIDLLEWCKTEALSKRLAWNTSDEHLCGRPLGLRFHQVLINLLLFHIN